MASFTAPSIVEEMHDRVRSVARLFDGPVKAKIAATAQWLGLTPARIENHYYGEVRRVDYDEVEQIRGRSAQIETLEQQRQTYEAARSAFLRSAPRALARLAPPQVARVEGKPLTDNGLRLIRAQIISEGRKQQAVRR